MHFTMTAVFLVGALTTAVATQEGARTRGEYLGTYGSVTESECNVELELLDGKKGRIVEICRREDGSRQDMSQATPATWSFAGDRVIVEYDDQRDVLEYDPNLSYESFGQRGSGPGLKLVAHPGFTSRLAGFGHLWKRPLAEEKHRR